MSAVNSMSRMYDNLEPTVIDEDLLRSAVEEQGPKEEAGKIAKAEGIDFGDVRSLRLDFKSKLTNNLALFEQDDACKVSYLNYEKKYMKMFVKKYSKKLHIYFYYQQIPKFLCYIVSCGCNIYIVNTLLFWYFIERRFI